jgi:thermitase
MRRPLAPLAVLAALLLVLLAPGAALAAADPLRPQQWHLDALEAADAWRHTQGRDVVVAVIDTGVQADHPDLRGRVLEGRDFVRPGSRPEDENGHGTLVAGLIAAGLDNGEGGAGLAPRSLVLPVRVLDADGRGSPSDVARGIRWATAQGARIINLSLTETPGGGLNLGLITTEVERAIREAREAGILVVGAAGNERARSTPYRAGLPVVVVGASDRDDEVWADSNRDRRTLFAPGVEMISTMVGGGYARADGTSFATPLVSAAAALLLALEPSLDVDTLERRLIETARPLGVGVGRLDLARAIGAARVATRRPPAPAGTATPPVSPSPAPPAASAEDPDAATPQPEPALPPPAHPAPEDQEEPEEAPAEPAEPVQAVPPEPAAVPVPAPTPEPPAAAPAVEDDRPGDGEEVALLPTPPAPGDAPTWPVPVAALLLALDVALLGGLLRGRTSALAA